MHTAHFLSPTWELTSIISVPGDGHLLLAFTGTKHTHGIHTYIIQKTHAYKIKINLFKKTDELVNILVFKIKHMSVDIFIFHTMNM